MLVFTISRGSATNLQYRSLQIEELIPYQVRKVRLVSAHEQSMFADGFYPLVNCFVQVLSDIVSKVMSK